MTGDQPIGREDELAAIMSFVQAAPTGPAGMVISGSAGIGKTILWLQGVSIAGAAGTDVLTSRPRQAETAFAFAALADLLNERFEHVAGQLPAPQRRALEVALLRAEGDDRGPDRHAVSVAVLSALRLLADERPVLLAIDDVQWIDPPSAHALSFVLRRLEAEAVSVLTTLRVTEGIPDPLDLETSLGERLTRLDVGPLPLDVFTRLIHERTDGRFSRPILVKIHEASGGNPLFGLEIVRAMRSVDGEPPPGEPLPVPDDLGNLLHDRIGSVPPETQDVLLLASATSSPTVELLRESGGSGDDRLGPAEAAGIVRVLSTGEVEFTHPLLASAVYGQATSAWRRDAHARLARTIADPEERARHLALSSSAPDPEVAGALDTAAIHASKRGAPWTAAELEELALRLTPDHDTAMHRQRSLHTSEYRFQAGDAGAARRAADDALRASTSGPERAEVLYLLSGFGWNDLTEIRPLLEQAVAESDGAPDLMASAMADLGWIEIVGGDLKVAARHARRAIELAGTGGDPGPRSLALITTAYAEFMLGIDASSLLAEAQELEDPQADRQMLSYLLTNSLNTLGAQRMWSGDLEGGRQILERAHTDVVERGRYLLLWEMLVYLSELETRAGAFARGLDYAEELLETLAEAGYDQARELGLWARSLAEAHLGMVEAARADATEGLALAERHRDLFHVITNRSVLGFLELSLGDPAAAHRWLEPLPDLLAARNIVEPGIYPVVPDAVEALIGIGEIDRAEEVLEPFQAWSEKLDRPLTLATAARSRGSIAAARGDLPAALAYVEDAVARHARVSQPFELARTTLAFGDIQRRAKQKRAAAASLRSALSMFEALGAPLWAAKARASLARISGRTATVGLTESERQTVVLAIEGRTNREIAESMFVSVRTVEANLSRAYAKLGVGSRRELRVDLLPPAPQEP